MGCDSPTPGLRELPMRELRAIGCSIAPGELPGQGERVEQLRRHVLRTRREPDRVELWFSGGLDVGVLREFMALELNCCSFFSMDWDAGERKLAIAAAEEHRQALAALSGILGA